MRSKAYVRLLDALREHGSEITERGDDSALAQCPAHPDGRPSLSLRSIEGSVLVSCMAGCSTPDVVDAVGLGMGDLFDDPKGFSYEYPGGRIVQRTPDKQFYQLGDKSDTSLYRADRITGEVVSVCEGEKDVLAIESLGGQAVSAPNGAKAKLERFDWEPLRGKVIRVIADRDEVGRQRAQAVAEYLAPIAKSVCIYEPVEGKDAADHIAAGHGLEDFKPLTPPDVLTFSDALDAWLDWMNSEGVQPIETPWPQLNNKLSGGLHPGRLYIVAARVGQGKSVIGQNMITHAAMNRVPTFVVSAEMPVTEIMSRVISAEVGIDYKHITMRDFSEAQTRVDEFIFKHRTIPMFVCDKPTVTIEEVAQKCRALKAQHDLRAVFIDYAQLITASDRRAPRQEQVAHIARACKLLAMELEVAVILAAQLNRNADSEAGPRIIDLRESGELENSADVVLLMHQIENSLNLGVNIAKNRTGPPGSVTLVRRFDQARADA